MKVRIPQHGRHLARSTVGSQRKRVPMAVCAVVVRGVWVIKNDCSIKYQQQGSEWQHRENCAVAALARPPLFGGQSPGWCMWIGSSGSIQVENCAGHGGTRVPVGSVSTAALPLSSPLEAGGKSKPHRRMCRATRRPCFHLFFYLSAMGRTGVSCQLSI